MFEGSGRRSGGRTPGPGAPLADSFGLAPRGGITVAAVPTGTATRRPHAPQTAARPASAAVTGMVFPQAGQFSLWLATNTSQQRTTTRRAAPPASSSAPAADRAMPATAYGAWRVARRTTPDNPGSPRHGRALGYLAAAAAQTSTFFTSPTL